ncbi:MAG TPA: hypothetical protein VJ253_03710 [Dehalococcoidia bacterium]|nr:hypothetical protein [Dehalococcoidia bacterium]
MIRGRFATQLAAAACALSLAAALFLALWPESYQGTSVTTDGRVTETSASLIEENGAEVLLWLLLPVAACLWALLASLSESTGAKAAMWLMGLLLLLFAWVSILSIGAFYLPPALALLVAALSATRRRRAA